MKKLFLISVVLMLLSGSAFGQPTNVPVCDSTHLPPNCTDYFGVGNWANSPLPSSPVTGFTIIASGSGYVNPVVEINDPTGTGASATATVSAGVITGVTAGAQGSGYILPQVTIVDVGANGSLGAPTCGGTSQPACGSGAMVTAVLGGPYSGGMPKFQDSFFDIKTTIATPDTTTFPGSDYYEIALVAYSQKMHSSLPATVLRGYVQAPSGSTGCSAALAAHPTYLGPVILAQKDRPVRVKFTNCLPPGSGGDLLIPMDSTYMGAGMGPNGTAYTENRATLHLHGGATPWISDGTPHQWTVPVGDIASLSKGESVAYVPDMFFDSTGLVTPVPKCSSTVTTNCYPNAVPAGLSNNPGQGSLSFFWTNQQGGRLMFYHDHAYGITRLNVYAGEAAGYLVVDPVQEDALSAASAPGTLGTTPDPSHLIPMVIQDKTFVPSAAQIDAQDPTWTANYGSTPGTPNVGDLWFPHVYMTNQNPYDPSGGNAFGRWDYGPWFFPPQTTLTAATPNTAVTVPCTSAAFPGQTLAPTPACPTCGCPIIPNPSGTPEGFMDTPVVNGVAYPVLHVAPAAYRFQILNAGNDRSWNLSWFAADPAQNNTEVAMLPAVPPANGAALPLCGAINPVAVPSLDIGLATALLDGSGNPLNGTGLPANCWPNYGPQPGIPSPQTMWAADGRVGGAPDPRTAGPAWIQIGSEGGLLPAPVVIPPTPINYEQNPRSITIGSVAVHGLWLGPAERADVIVDFSRFAGKTLILYNDGPTPAPAIDSRLDYFTGDGDQSPIGGAPNTPPGYGPNTRTVMQVIVDSYAPNTVPFNLSSLKAAFASTPTTAGLFASTQPTTIVPEAGYNSAYSAIFSNSYASIQGDGLTFTPIAPLTFDQPCSATSPAQCETFGRKAIQELFTLDYGRMNATLGVELPLTNFLTQTTIPYGYAEWPTEIIRQGETQLWKITHNGVDSHFIHFHLFNVQVINRMGWDGTLRPPDANELGWKETVRMNPLEDIVVALQPITPTLPFPVPDSIRALDVTLPDAVASPATSGIDPNTGNAGAPTINNQLNFGWEYVWHCHILGHEENDMMRPIIFQVAPPAPSSVIAVADGTGGYNVSWTDESASESGYNLQRDTDPLFSAPVDLLTNQSPSVPETAYGGTITYHDTTAPAGTVYYRVQAVDDFTPLSPLSGLFQVSPIYSAWVVVPSTTNPIAGVSPTSLNFGNQLVPTTGGPQSVTLSNTGAAPLTFTINVTGVNASAYSLPVSVSPCVSPLAAGASCTIDVNFSPSAPGARSAAVSIVSNDPVNPTLNVALSGVGTATTSLGINAPTITYGADGNVTVTVTSPQVTPVTGTVSMTVDGGVPIYQALVSGSTTFTLTAPPASVAGHSLSANYAAQDGFGARSNTGTLIVNPAPLTISATPNPASMAYGGTVPAIIPGFSGFVLGQGPTNLTGTVVCTTTATNASQVSGSPYPSSCSGATSTNYAITYVPGVVNVNQSTSTTTITSNLPSPSILGQIVTIGFHVAPQFTGTPTGSVTVTASTGESCSGALSSGSGACAITFSAPGQRTLTAVYAGDSNFLTSPSAPANQVVSSLSVSTSSLLFGNQVLGTSSASQAATLTNVGTAPLTINQIAFTGGNAADFMQTNTCPVGGSLSAGSSCQIYITFSPVGPAATGVRTSTLALTDSDTTSPQSILLTGTGVAPSLSNGFPVIIAETLAGYPDIQSAYNAIGTGQSTGQTIEAQAGVENLNPLLFNYPVSVKIRDGYNNSMFTNATGATVVVGSIVISQGTVDMGNIVIQ